MFKFRPLLRFLCLINSFYRRCVHAHKEQLSPQHQPPLPGGDNWNCRFRLYMVGPATLVDKEEDSTACVWMTTGNSGEVKSISTGTSSKDSPSDKKIAAEELPTADSSPGIPRRLVCKRLQKCLRMETRLVSIVR